MLTNMKKIIALLLISFGLSGQGTYLKLKQLERSATAGSLIITGASGIPEYTSSIDYSKISGVPTLTAYVPYTGATSSVNLGANSFSVGGSSTVGGNEIVVGSITSPTLYGSSSSGGTLYLSSTTDATKGNIILGINGGTVNAPTQLVVGSNSISNSFMLSVSSTSLNNSDVYLNGVNNSRIFFKNNTSGNLWRLHLSTDAANTAGLDNIGFGQSSNPDLNYLSISNSTGYVRVKNGLKIGSLATPTKTLDVTGDAVFSNSVVAASYSAVGNVTVTGGLIYGTTSANFIQLDNGIGAKLAYNSNNLWTVGNQTGQLNLNGGAQQSWNTSGTALTGSMSITARFIKPQGTDVASATGSISLGSGGNVFELTGTNAVTSIRNTSWVNGSEITLLFTSTASLTDGVANSGSDIGFELAGNTNFTGSAEATITLILCEIGGVQRWREKCRSVN